jgi:hypothetical protein
MYLPLPTWVVRRIVRQNPWLLSDDGTVSRSVTYGFGIGEIPISTRTMLLPAQRARLIAEAEAGTLFPDRGARSHG